MTHRYNCAVRPPLNRASSTSHRLTDEFIARMRAFATAFPVAHAFLKRIEQEGPAHGLWLSTAVNAHLYKRDAFLAYLKLKNIEHRPPSLVISPKFNQQIVAQTTDQSARLFPQPFDDVVREHGGLAAKWAVRHANRSTEFTAATPAAFFDVLYTAVIALDLPAPG
jgi:hypothetical protein